MLTVIEFSKEVLLSTFPPVECIFAKMMPVPQISFSSMQTVALK